MSVVSFVGISLSVTELEMDQMMDYLEVASLIRAKPVDLVWTRWLKPEDIPIDAVVEKFNKKIMDRFCVNPECFKRGVSFPENIVWDSDPDLEVYVIGTFSEMKTYVDSYLRLEKNISGHVCCDGFTSSYIYQIKTERKSRHSVEVMDCGFLYK